MALTDTAALLVGVVLPQPVVSRDRASSPAITVVRSVPFP